MVLPSDWSYLASENHKKWFKEYANNNTLFQQNFAHAWKVVSEKGWEGKLYKCNPVECTVSTGNVTCPVIGRPMGEFAKGKHANLQFMGTGPKSGRPVSLSFSQ